MSGATAIYEGRELEKNEPWIGTDSNSEGSQLEGAVC
jgi:hypothetical protein